LKKSWVLDEVCPLWTVIKCFSTTADQLLRDSLQVTSGYMILALPISRYQRNVMGDRLNQLKSTGFRPYDSLESWTAAYRPNHCHQPGGYFPPISVRRYRPPAL